MCERRVRRSLCGARQPLVDAASSAAQEVKQGHVAAQDGVAGSVLEFYREMLAYRRGSAALMRGRTRFLDVAEPVLMFDRTLDGSTVTCVFNLSPGTVHVGAKGDLTGISQNVVMGADGLTLGPNGFAFLV